jgi:NitT/TauT family transport system substrate-binding protein
MKIFVRRFLAITLLAVALPVGAYGQTPAPAAPIVLKIGALPSESSAEVIYGVEGGFFMKQGLDVEVQIFNSGSAIAAAVAAGALDAGLSDAVSIISAHTHGLPFVYLFPGAVSTEAVPEFNIVVRGDSPIRIARDLDGSTIAVNGLHNVAQVEAQAWIDRNGGNSKNIQFIELPLPAHKDAVLQGRITATMDTEPFATLDADSGMRVIPLAKNGIAPAFLVNGWVTTRDWVTRNPLAAARFTAALHDIAVWANRNHNVTAPILARYTKIPEAVVLRMRRYTYAQDADPSVIQPVIDACVRYGIIPVTFNATEILVAKAGHN